jgi:hypothetical protein
MSFLFRLKLLHLFIKVVFPDRLHPGMQMASTPVRRSESAAVQAPRFVRPPGGIPDFVEDRDDGLEDDEVVDRWKDYIDDVDVIANTRSFLESMWTK